MKDARKVTHYINEWKAIYAIGSWVGLDQHGQICWVTDDGAVPIEFVPLIQQERDRFWLDTSRLLRENYRVFVEDELEIPL